MKHVKILLQLHSIKLILLSALAVIFLVVTATEKTNDTKSRQPDVSVANEDARR